MNQPSRDPLDTALGALPLDVTPSRDLWPDIQAAIAADSAAPARPVHTHRWVQLAAAVLLVVSSSVLTYFIVQRSMEQEIVKARQQVAKQLEPVLDAMPVRFDGYELLGKSYEDARAQLDAEYERRLANLPPVVRAKVQHDVEGVRRSAREISTILAQYPSDPLLQDLLVSTYQRELQLLADVNSMAASDAAGMDL